MSLLRADKRIRFEVMFFIDGSTVPHKHVIAGTTRDDAVERLKRAYPGRAVLVLSATAAYDDANALERERLKEKGEANGAS